VGITLQVGELEFPTEENSKGPIPTLFIDNKGRKMCLDTGLGIVPEEGRNLLSFSILTPVPCYLLGAFGFV
jgi:hypothetical protein